jgi:hypothetical protein
MEDKMAKTKSNSERVSERKGSVFLTEALSRTMIRNKGTIPRGRYPVPSISCLNKAAQLLKIVNAITNESAMTILLALT